MTAESGQSSGDADEPNQAAKSSAEGDEKQRKVAKTMVEGQLPNLPEPTSSQTSGTNDPGASSKDRKVAKTRLEMSRPTSEQIESAPEVSGQSRKIEKTKLEISRPILNEGQGAATKYTLSDAPPQNLSAVSGLENPTQEEVQSAPGTTSETKRVVPKTMLEITPPGLADIGGDVQDADTPVARKIPKTMLELALPADSDMGKQVKKIAKTKLDIANLDAIGTTKQTQDTTIPVKVRKTLTQERTIPGALQNKSVTSLDQKVTDDSIKLAAKKAAPAPKERFVAKTMLDHSVLSEQIEKSHEKEKVRAAYMAQVKANEPQQEFHEVDSKKMASRCAFTWTESGAKTGRVKACDKCQTQVYDFSGLEMPEAEALIYKHESRKKFSLYKREDGKFMTRDCPVQAQRKRNLLLLCLVGAVVVICALATLLLMPPPAKPPETTVAPANSGTPVMHNSTSASGNSRSTSGNSTSASSNSTSGNSSSQSVSAPVQSKDGIIHFEAGQTVEQNAALNNSLFTSTGTNSKSSNPATSATTPTTPAAQPAPVTTTGTPESKYWDK